MVGDNPHKPGRPSHTYHSYAPQRCDRRAAADPGGGGSGRQLDLYYGEIAAGPAAKVFEDAALVTSLADEVLTVAQLYRDRAAGENNFDELKNHWAGAVLPPGICRAAG